VGDNVFFSDGSLGNPTSWLWDFGDGGTSIDPNPVYTYMETGEYTVTLTIGDGTGTSTLTEPEYISVMSPSAAPQASFTADPMSGAVPLEVSFQEPQHRRCDLLAVGFRGWQHLDAAQPHPRLHPGGRLHRQPDGQQPARIRHPYLGSCHQRRSALTLPAACCEPVSYTANSWLSWGSSGRTPWILSQIACPGSSPAGIVFMI